MSAPLLDQRSRDVLIAVIAEYVQTAEPVGSRAVARRHMRGLSAATIRNAMADLEDMGYLAQPHTSAGRVPTDQAYRFYVESFPPPSPAAPRAAEPATPRRGAVDSFMEKTSSHLSTATRMTGRSEE